MGTLTRFVVAAVAAVVLAVVTVGCAELEASDDESAEASSSGDLGVVRDDDYGEDWPFTVGSVTVGCRLESASENEDAVVMEAGGDTYALNDSAIAWAEEQGWLRLEGADILEDGAPSEGVLSSLIAEGSKLCMIDG